MSTPGKPSAVRPSQSMLFDVETIRVLTPTTREERAGFLEEVGLNTALLDRGKVYIDLFTDGATGARVVHSLTERERGDLGFGPMSHPSCRKLMEATNRLFGFEFAVPASYGRAAERIWLSLHARPNSKVIGNMAFPSIRNHVAKMGAEFVNVVGDCAFDATSDEPFKGNADLDKLKSALKGGDVSCIYMETLVNECGGHPISLENLARVQALASEHGVPLFLDGTRLLENCYLIKQRESSWAEASVMQIAREMCSHVDAMTMSAQKDFSLGRGGLIATNDPAAFGNAYRTAFLDGNLPTGEEVTGLASALPIFFESDGFCRQRVAQVESVWNRLVDAGVPCVRPAGGHGIFIDCAAFFSHLGPPCDLQTTLSAHLYLACGIRARDDLPKTKEMLDSGNQWIRLAFPVRRYTDAHMNDIVDTLVWLYHQREELVPAVTINDAPPKRYAWKEGL